MIELNSPLTVPGGADITIDGNGLVLDGQQEGSEVLDILNDQGTTSLALNGVTITHGQVGVGIAVDHAGGGGVRLTCMFAVKEAGSNSSGRLTGCIAVDHVGGNGVRLTCMFAVKEAGSNSSGRLTGCIAVDHVGGNGVRLTCRSIDGRVGDGAGVTVCTAMDSQGSNAPAVFFAKSVFGPNGGHISLDTHFQYATYKWTGASASCLMAVDHQGGGGGVRLTCRATQG